MALKCPACQNSLTEMPVGNILVDICQGGCGGIWFDNFELKKVNEQQEHQGEDLLNIERDPHVHVDATQKRDCPKCSNIKMMRRFASITRKVEIDECPSCGGIWLDAGELRDIRNEFANEEERRQAFDQYFADVFEETLKQKQVDMQQDLEQTRNSIRVFRFVCPSYWIPGKQKWGAF